MRGELDADGYAAEVSLVKRADRGIGRAALDEVSGGVGHSRHAGAG